MGCTPWGVRRSYSLMPTFVNQLLSLYQEGCLKFNQISLRKSVVSFGEIMLRLTPYSQFERLEQTQNLKMSFAGAESNVVTSLARLGQEAFFVTQLPANALGNGATNLLRKFGVNTEFIAYEGDRIGIYFIEQGASLRPSKVTYDRANAAIQKMNPDLFDWNRILKGKDWLHLTGITPALSSTCAEQTIEAAATAKTNGLTVSFDMNYRRKLWGDRQKAKDIFNEILKYTDVLLANSGAIYDVYGDVGKQEDEEIMKKAYEMFDVNQVAFTVRKHFSASHNAWQGMLFDGDAVVKSKVYDLQIVDRFGGGDAFAAGLIHGCCRNLNPKEIIEFATAASALKHSIPGDLNIITEEEVNAIINGGTSGHVER